MTVIAIRGASGRMGQAVAAVLDRQGLVRAAAPDEADVVVDFTTAAASAQFAHECASRGGPALVIGPTGFDAEQEAIVAAAATRIAIVKSGNFSLGINLLLGLVAQAARALGPQEYDVEITEAHHRRKLDAPSGAALMLGAAVAAARGVDLEAAAVRARDGWTGARAPGSIGFSVVRGGGIVGEHAVVFAAEDEILTLAHSARDRSLFARGAVAAALWVVGRAPGLYDMQDVLGLNGRGTGG